MGNNKRGILSASCKACGHSFTLDMRHKLTTFILKNPPDQKLNAQGTSLTERKDKKRLSPIRMGKVRKALQLRSFLPKRMKTQMRRQKTIWTLMISKKIQFDFFSFTSTSSKYLMQK